MSALPIMPVQEETIHAGVLLRRIALELSALAVDAEATGVRIASAAGGSDAEAAMRAVQSVDLHAQTLQNLAGVVETLSETMPEGLASDASTLHSLVTLADLSRRLLRPETARETAHAGLVELF